MHRFCRNILGKSFLSENVNELFFRSRESQLLGVRDPGWYLTEPTVLVTKLVGVRVLKFASARVAETSLNSSAAMPVPVPLSVVDPLSIETFKRDAIKTLEEELRTLVIGSSENRTGAEDMRGIASILVGLERLEVPR